MEITRRRVLVGAAALGANSAFAEWAPNAHDPDPAFNVLDRDSRSSGLWDSTFL
jgi:hypothetical protein